MTPSYLTLARREVVPPEPPSGDVFTLDWSHSTGNSDAATSDGGKATVDRYCSTRVDVLSVVNQATLTSRGITWTRTPNVLSVRSIDPGCGHVELVDHWDTPEAGDRWAVRYFVCNGANQDDTKQHPACYWPVGAIEVVHTYIETRDQFDVPLSPADGRWTHGMTFAGLDFPWYAMDGGSRRILSADTWYRTEHIIHWLSATTFRVYPRLYTLAGDLLNDYTTYRHANAANGTMEEWYGAGNFFEVNDGTSQNIRTISWGMGQSNDSNEYFYFADCALRYAASNTDFIGAD
jgi:hypothetical protein